MTTLLCEDVTTWPDVAMLLGSLALFVGFCALLAWRA